eukprot:7391868-Prymnesium_polylepis.2
MALLCALFLCGATAFQDDDSALKLDKNGDGLYDGRHGKRKPPGPPKKAYGGRGFEYVTAMHAHACPVRVPCPVGPALALECSILLLGYVARSRTSLSQLSAIEAPPVALQRARAWHQGHRIAGVQSSFVLLRHHGAPPLGTPESRMRTYANDSDELGAVHSDELGAMRCAAAHCSPPHAHCTHARCTHVRTL